MTDGPNGERFLVTGALGCIGAWTVRTLIREGVPVVAFDMGRDPRRIAQIVDPDDLERVTFVAGDGWGIFAQADYRRTFFEEADDADPSINNGFRLFIGARMILD